MPNEGPMSVQTTREVEEELTATEPSLVDQLVRALRNEWYLSYNTARFHYR